MSLEFEATYEHGVLRLDQPLLLPEHARVVGIVVPAAGANEGLKPVSDEEFDSELDRLSLDVRPLPPDFSRADIYSDHD